MKYCEVVSWIRKTEAVETYKKHCGVELNSYESYLGDLRSIKTVQLWEVIPQLVAFLFIGQLRS